MVSHIRCSRAQRQPVSRKGAGGLDASHRQQWRVNRWQQPISILTSRCTEQMELCRDGMIRAGCAASSSRSHRTAQGQDRDGWMLVLQMGEGGVIVSAVVSSMQLAQHQPTTLHGREAINRECAFVYFWVCLFTRSAVSNTHLSADPARHQSRSRPRCNQRTRRMTVSRT